MRRRDLVMLIGAAAAWPLPTHAQQRAKRSRVGILAAQPFAAIERFKAKLKELGYVEGENLTIEARFSAGRDELYPSFVAELLSTGIDVIVVGGTPAALAAKRATDTVPIVLGSVGDVLSTGIVASLGHPGGNITGFSAVNVELEEKRLELLKELSPRVSRIGLLANADNPLNRVNIETVTRSAALWNLSVEVVEVSGASEVERALRRLAATKPDAALIASDTLLLTERRQIIDFMALHRIPAIYPFREYAEAGGLLVHGANLSVLFEGAASYVDRILKGAKPGDLPIQQASAFELILNLKTAKALGLDIPPTLLARADAVIE
jgi:putative ABC transport system substrate-binding protein